MRGASRIALAMGVLLLAATPARPQDPQAEREKARADRERLRDAAKERTRAARDHSRGREEHEYQRGLHALDQRQWDSAIQTFDAVAKLGGTRADGALYWKAYAQNKLGKRDDALATLGELAKSFPGSRWLNDAKALEVEVRQAAGQPVTPESESDEELKLYALNSLAHSDPERAVPMLQKILQGSYSPKLKERALFVLSQSNSAPARDIVTQAARGQSNPDVQLKAVQYLGMMGGKEGRQALADIYASSSDANVKSAILRGFLGAGDRDRVLAAAKSEQNPELRRQAIEELGAMGAQEQVWQLYAAESSPEVKLALIRALLMGGNTDKLIEVARSEKDVNLRREAIRMLGVAGHRKGGDKPATDVLPSLYASETDPGIRREILNALLLAGNAKALIDIARKETDPSLKKSAVEKIGMMKSKEATDFMLEILNK